MSREIDDQSEAVEVLSELLAYIEERKAAAKHSADSGEGLYPYGKIFAYEEIKGWITKRLGEKTDKGKSAKKHGNSVLDRDEICYAIAHALAYGISKAIDDWYWEQIIKEDIEYLEEVANGQR